MRFDSGMISPESRESTSVPTLELREFGKVRRLWGHLARSGNFNPLNCLGCIAIFVNRHTVFIGCAGLKIDLLATHPAEIRMLELGH